MNKIFVSILFAVILVLGINKITDVIYHNPAPQTSAYQVNVTTVASNETQTSSESSEAGDILALFASTDLAKAKKLFSAKCSSCHNVAKGSKHKIGPSLNNIWRKVGSAPDYKYSKALLAYGKTWDVAELDGFLLNPKKWIPKNKMGFLGLKKPEDRAKIIFFLNKNTDNPLPLQ